MQRPNSFPPSPSVRALRQRSPPQRSGVGMAHRLVHDLVHRLASGCLPVFSSDGLALYFYALTAHFGEWVQELGRRRRQWVVAAELLYAQVIKRCRRKRITEVRWQIQLGTIETYRQALRALGLTGRIQTAFVERLNLTFRRSIAGLARRSWSLPCSLGELVLHFDPHWPPQMPHRSFRWGVGKCWWRAYYHFVRPHAALTVQQPVGDPQGGTRLHRTRARTPAQAAGLTNHRWTVLELLAFPAPPLVAG
jgi:hypothetical protein